jgi:hypothetical protein
MDTNFRKEEARVRYAIGYRRQAIYQYYDEKLGSSENLNLVLF